MTGFGLGATTISSEVVSSIKREAANVTARIWRSYTTQRVQPTYSHSTEVHHIVAQRSNNPNAVHSRSILLNVGIDVNSSINLVPLKTGLHRRLHSNSYYALVDRILTNAY